jgi:hypothetical protein
MVLLYELIQRIQGELVVSPVSTRSIMFRRYLVPFKAHRLPHVLTDACVIGGGVAGLRAALEIANAGGPTAGGVGGAGGRDVLLVTKTDLKESNTYYAQGGIATVWRPEDSFESHINDTVTVACGLGNRAAIETVVREAPARIQELIDWGANFDRDIPTPASFTPWATPPGANSPTLSLASVGSIRISRFSNTPSCSI